MLGYHLQQVVNIIGRSVGFPDGWPQCNGQFLPSLDNSGILVQMIHRIGALVVGLILIGSFMKMDNNTASNSSNAAFLSSLKFTTILWFANLFVGATYIIQAKVGDFPEWISLLHLLIGVSTFLAAMCGPMMFRLSGSNLMKMSSEFMESSLLTPTLPNPRC